MDFKTKQRSGGPQYHKISVVSSNTFADLEMTTNMEESSGQSSKPSCWRRPLYIVSVSIIIVGLLAAVYFLVIKRNDSETTTTVDLTALPSSMIIAVASAAYQYEGAWDEEGKGESIWDYFTHNDPTEIADLSNGDVACDSYHKYKEDVSMVKDSGFQMYRLSISWSRILPYGYNNYTNPYGIAYYNNLLDELVANGIEPMVTLYHWDLPQALEDIGGWTNPIMADHFVNYSKIVFENFGDRVKWWISINEPLQITLGYGGTQLAPGLGDHGVSDYLACHNLLRAHAKVYRLYTDSYKPTQLGQIGISIHFYSVMPKNESSSEDYAAAERTMQFQVGIFAHPIFSKEGDYPAIVRTNVDYNSQLENRTTSRLPFFTAEEIEELKGSSDFFGVNHYSTLLSTTGVATSDPSWDRDSGSITSRNTDLPLASNSTWIRVYPEGFRHVLNWIKAEYDNPPVFVTENGCTSAYGLDDYDKASFYYMYISAMLKAVYEDGCNVTGYTAWSLMDNFEWYSGYTQKFGLWYVNFTDPDRPRTMKKSAEFFKEMITNRKLPDLATFNTTASSENTTVTYG